MVYITNESDKMTILKSQNAQISKVEIINQTDHNKIEVELSVDDVDYSKNTIVINLDNIKPRITTSGQYDYFLYSNDILVESGILQFDDYSTKIEEYNINQNIIQYEREN